MLLAFILVSQYKFAKLYLMMLVVFSFLNLSRIRNASEISYDRSVLFNDSCCLSSSSELGSLSSSAELGNLCIVLLLILRYINTISRAMDQTINYIFDITDG